jgi:hypothetical protein
MDEVIKIFSSIISGLGLSWGIYVWFAKKKEEKLLEEKHQADLRFQKFSELVEKEVSDMKNKIEAQERQFVIMKTAYVATREQLKSFQKDMETNQARTEKVLDKYESKIDNLGKVIVK